MSVIPTRLDNHGRLVPLSTPVPCRSCNGELPAGFDGECPWCHELAGISTDLLFAKLTAGECGGCDLKLPEVFIGTSRELAAEARRLEESGQMPSVNELVTAIEEAKKLFGPKPEKKQ